MVLYPHFFLFCKETSNEEDGSAEGDGNEVTTLIFRVDEEDESRQEQQQVEDDNTGEKGEETSQEPNEPEEQQTEHEPDQQLSEQDTADESVQQLSCKTAKAAEVVLGKTPDVVQPDKLRTSLNRKPKSRDCINRYESHLAKIQVFVLKATQQLNAELKASDTFSFDAASTNSKPA